MQQRGGVHELDEGRGFDVFLVLDAAGAAREHTKQGAQAFAAAGDDVFGDLVDEGHRALQPGPDHGVDAGKIGADQAANVLERTSPGASTERGAERELGSEVTLELI